MDIKPPQRYKSRRTDYRDLVLGVRSKIVVTKIAAPAYIPQSAIHKLSRLIYIAAMALIIISILIPVFIVKPKIHAQISTVGPNTPGACSSGGSGTDAWSNPGNAIGSDNSRAVSPSSVQSMAASETTKFLTCTGFNFSIPTSANLLGIQASIERSAANNSCCGGNGIYTNSIMLVKNVSGVPTTVGDDKAAFISSPWATSDTVDTYGSSSDTWNAGLSPSDINHTNFGVTLQAIQSVFASGSNQARVDAMTITVTYSGFSQLTQRGYIWENDDEDLVGGDAYDDNSQQAAGNTAVTGVRQGERLTLRTQIQNDGAYTSNGNIGLFYDKNDGNWRRVTYPNTIPGNGSGCTASNWQCTLVHGTGNAGQNTKFGLDERGNPVALYTRTTGNIIEAKYVGSGGNCDTLGGSDAWSCDTVAVASTNTSAIDVAIGPNGNRYAMFYTAGQVGVIAKYVGSGGNCDTSYSGSDAWNCTTYTGGSNGAGPAVAQLGVTSDNTVYAVTYTGFGSTANTYMCGGPAGSLSCSIIAWPDLNNTSFASSPDVKDMIYQNSANDLVYAYYVGSGGSCTDTSWNCTTIDDTSGNIGKYGSLTHSPGGIPYISYYDSTNGDLRLAHYVGINGTGCKTGVTSWTCEVIDNSNEGQYTSLAFSPAGIPYISYYDNNAADLKLAHYVGSGGSCTGSTNSGTWSCDVIDSTIADVGKYSSLTFADNGQPYIGYYDGTNNDFRVATYPPGDGDIVLATPAGGIHGDNISESHADMTATTDTTNRDDSDCIGGGAWSNGKLFNSIESSGLTLAAGSCTEIAFVIDTSQAAAGTTYRFIIATADSFQNEKGKWRGLTNITQYPTLTIASSTILRGTKGVEPQLSSCNGTNWTCGLIDGTATDRGQYSAMSFSPDGTAYIAYYDNTTGAKDLHLAKYVGTGGTGCATGVVMWTCITLDDTSANIGQYISIMFNQEGNGYISYYDVTNTSLRVASYVGTGNGSGCKTGITDWTCETVDNTNTDTGTYSSIAIGKNGTPYVSYYNGSGQLNLKMAQYVGSGAGNCSDTDWYCETVDSANDVGQFSAIAISPDGMPYISYYDATAANLNLRVAQYVGAGGTGCAIASWNCTVVEATTSGTNDVGKYTSIAFNGSGVPYVSYYDVSGTALRVAFYDGDAVASGCGGGSAAWTCTAVDNTATDTGQYSSIAFSPSGTAYISYYDTTPRLRVAQYDGDAITSGCTDNAWTCTSIDTAGSTGTYSSIAFSKSGLPYISYYDAGANLDLKVAKISQTLNKPNMSSLFDIPGRNGRWENGFYSLADGRSPRSNNNGVCGSAISSYAGLCGIFDDNGDADTITAQINERPVYSFAQSFDNNTILPTAVWAGGTTVAPSTAGTTGDIKLQVYKFGTTNAWVDVATNSSSATCSASDNCRVSGIPSGTIGDYFESDGAGNYWMYWRVYQVESASAAETLSTDLFQLQFINKQMRHGKLFENNAKRAFTF